MAWNLLIVGVCQCQITVYFTSFVGSKTKSSDAARKVDEDKEFPDANCKIIEQFL
jgi:hypothetical protein